MTKRRTKSKVPEDQSSQFLRFKEMAREVEADESPDALDKAFGRLNPKRRTPNPNAKR